MDFNALISKSPMRRIIDYLGNQLQLTSDGAVTIGNDIQYPIAADGDSVYVKDVWVGQSIITGWVDADDAGGDIVNIPFNNLHTAIRNTTSDNPKSITVHFNRTVFFNQVGLGCAVHPGENFSNVKIKVLGSGQVIRTSYDDSTNNDKLTSRNYQFGPELGNAIILEFHTADPICITNITIQKMIGVSSILKALKPDGTVTNIDATTGGNLKVSLEEIESGISDDTNQSLRVSPHVVDEFGVSARILADNMFQGALITIPPEHHEIHCGDSYEVSDIATIPNGAVREYLIIVPNELGTGQDLKLFHTRFVVSVTAEATAELFEGPTVTANGTAVSVVNRNRQYPLTDFLGVNHTPTVTVDGTRLRVAKLGSGRSAGGVATRADELILKNNTMYLVRITNDSTANNFLNFGLDYYVHPGV